MQTITLNVEDRVFDKIYYFLSNLPKDEVQIVENHSIEDWSYLEPEIEKGINSGKNIKSHVDIIKEIKEKYV